MELHKRNLSPVNTRLHACFTQKSTIRKRQPPSEFSLPYSQLPYSKIQHASHKPKSTLLPKNMTHIQKVTCFLLCCCNSLDSLLLAGLNNVSIKTSTADYNTLKHVNHTLNYVATNPNAMLLHKGISMIVQAHSNLFHLCASRVKCEVLLESFRKKRKLHKWCY